MDHENERDQFEALGVMYEEMFLLPWRKHLESFSVFASLGDVAGKDVLDIGCGTGLYSRQLKQRGAARVVGYDVSTGMIEIARQAERVEPLGIEYTEQTGLIGEGAFDTALAVYVLPYAEDYQTLVSLCTLASRALRPGGRFVTLPVNPGFHGDRTYYQRYGLRLAEAEPRRDASRVTLELCFGDYDERITARYWSKETLEKALREAGFVSISWPVFQVSEEGVARHGKDFWLPYLNCPHAALISCTKA
ncbi:methyltransferase domain-containing protein [Streptomyces sp. NPDC007205]|uniref:class I SAM-dependent methyltransferase n=1 Tax=Streptomyces sp. NPDC007205 TaxID=3154316 RepID=UPI0033FA6C78